MTGSHLSLAEPAADRAAFGLELLARTAAVHGAVTDDYALADALLPNTPSDRVRALFAGLLNEFASARMQLGRDDDEAAKHDGAAHTLAMEAVEADRSGGIEPTEVQLGGIGAPQAYWLGISDRGIRVTAVPRFSPRPAVAVQIVGGKATLTHDEAAEFALSLLSAIAWTGR